MAGWAGQTITATTDQQRRGGALRTTISTGYRRYKCSDDNGVILSPHSDYERTSYNPRDFQSRFSTSENIEGFGFHSNDGEDFEEEGFGRDDLFLDHPGISNSDRTSHDYEDGKV